MHYTCIACITIDSVLRMKKKEISTNLFRECKCKIKKTIMSEFIDAELNQTLILILNDYCNFFYS